VDIRIRFEQLTEARFEQLARCHRLDIEARSGRVAVRQLGGLRLRGQRAPDLVRNLVRLEADAGADAEAVCARKGLAQEIPRPLGGLPRIVKLDVRCGR
jgi:hypothetical protein